MKSSVLAVLCLLFSVSALGQSTTVSATVTDAGGQAWIRGTYSFSFKVSPSNPTAQYFWNGSPFSSTQTIQGQLDGSAHFSVSVPSNTSITPAGSTWVLTLCSIARGNSPCYTTQGLTITGATQSLSSIHPPAISIDLTHVAFPFVTAYSSSEITTATFAGLFWNYTLSHYFYCGAITPSGNDQTYGACTNWLELCQVGDGLCGGGGGGNVSVQHNGTLVGTEPIINFIDGTNVTLTVTNNVGATRIDTTIAASGGGGTGCTLPSIDRAVLSEHPAGTCYDSLHWTWNDDSSKQLYQIGNGTNTLSTNASLAFLQGGNITVTGDTAGNIHGLMDFGGSSIITQSNANSGINDAVHIGGTPTGTAQNRITATAGGFILDVMCLVQGCTDLGLTHEGIVATGSGGLADTNINEVLSAGVSNKITADSTGNTSSIFILGEQTNVSSVSGCNDSDDFIIGEFSTVACTSSGSADLNSTIVLGFNHNLSSSTAHTMSNVFLLGDTLTATQNGGASISDIGLFGKNLTAINCSDYYAIGENITTCASNEINIGLSASPEIQITPGSVKILGATVTPGPAVQASSITTLGGNVGLSANTLTTVTTKNVTMPSSGCPCRAFVSYSIHLTGGNPQVVDADVSDGTNRFAQGGLLITGSHSYAAVQSSSYSTGTYANGVSKTFTLEIELNNGGDTVLAAPNFAGFQNTWLNVVIMTSN